MLERAGIGITDLCNPNQVWQVLSSNPIWLGDKLYFNGNSQQIKETMGATVVGPYSFSMAFDVLSTFNSQTIVGMGSAASTDKYFHLKCTASTSITWGQFGDDGAFTVPNMSNRRCHAVGSMTQEKVQSFFFDGVFIGNRTATGLFSGSNTLGYPGVNSVVSTSLCACEHIYIWNRALSREEAAWLFQEPYCFLISGWRRRMVSLAKQLSDSITLTGTGAVSFSAKVSVPESITLTGTSGITVASGTNQPESFTLTATSGFSLAYALNSGPTVSMSATPGYSTADKIDAVNSVSFSAAGSLVFTTGFAESLSFTAAPGISLSYALAVPGSISLSATGAIALSATVSLVDALDLGLTATLVLADVGSLKATLGISATGAITFAAKLSVPESIHPTAVSGIAVTENADVLASLTFAPVASVVFSPSSGIGLSMTIAATSGISVADGLTTPHPGEFRPDPSSGAPGIFKAPGSSTATPGNLRPSGISGSPGIFKPKK